MVFHSVRNVSICSESHRGLEFLPESGVNVRALAARAVPRGIGVVERRQRRGDRRGGREAMIDAGLAGFFLLYSEKRGTITAPCPYRAG